MKGDFTRDTFHLAQHFSRVLMQQGRVTLDADHNEQTAILLRYLRMLARDIIGPYAGVDGGFVLATDQKGVFAIGEGRYYVDGILVENDTKNCTYKNQPDYPAPARKDLDPLLQAIDQEDKNSQFWIYLDVWERHITPLEDDSIREKALGGPDTCTRAKIVWQVKALPLTEDLGTKKAEAEKNVSEQLDKLWKNKAQWEKKFIAEADEKKQVTLLQQLQRLDEQLERLNHLSFLPPHEVLLSQLVRLSNARLAARVDPGLKTEDACVTPPASKYRGAENQLYRVEVHRGGVAWDGRRDKEGNPKGNIAGAATFKWSRDNGSVATARLGVEGSDLQVANARGFAAGNWVELSDDTSELLGNPGTLVQLVKVEGNILSADPATTLPPVSNFPKHPKVRRWDQIETGAVTLVDGAMPIQESANDWIDLEDGVQIQFSAGGEYRTGDYWLIPARVATGNVEWPQADDLNPQPLPPHGIEHHYALLGFASWPNQKLNIENSRFEFWPLFFSVAQSSLKHGPLVHFHEPGLILREPDVAKAVPAKAPKARKRPAKKGPASSAEGSPS